MAALANSDLTFTLIKKRKYDRGLASLWTIAWSTGKTFPGGGIAVTPANFGLVKNIESVVCVSSGTGFKMAFDRTLSKLTFQGSALTPITAAATGTTLEVEVRGK